MKIIHFICVGNTYRSRMAEAYFNSLQVAGWHAVSSGVHAEDNRNGPITIYASNIIKKNLSPFASASWTQTNQENLSKATHVVFMENSVYETCKDVLKLEIPDFEIWKIADVDPRTVTQEEIKLISEKTFLEIKENIDKLIHTL